jgi:DNA-binding MarR family transcriptional regulator
VVNAGKSIPLTELLLKLISGGRVLDFQRLPAYTSIMKTEHNKLPAPCLCNALRQATRTVTRLYDEELRRVGLRSTQYSLLRHLGRSGPIRQRDLSDRMLLDETTLTRNLRPLIESEWVIIEAGQDRREKLVRITEAGTATLKNALPAWERAQKRMQTVISTEGWSNLLSVLSEVAQLATDA